MLGNLSIEVSRVSRSFPDIRRGTARLAAEQRQEMIALGEAGQTDRRAERASDIGNRIGVPSSTGKLAGAGNSRCQTTPAPSPTPSGAAA